jgi:type II secretory pathway component GspD/PulD (secretin)
MIFERCGVRIGRLLGLAALVLCLAAVAEARQTWTLPSGDVDLKEFTDLTAKATGRTILYGADFKGSVHIDAGKKKVSADDLWKAYLSALAKNGWGVVIHGQVARVAPRQELMTQEGPVVIGPSDGKRNDDGMLTAVFELNSADPVEISTEITPLVGRDGQVIPLSTQNRVIVVASAANVEKVRVLLKKLDAPTSREQIEVVRLQRANPTALAEMLNQLFSTNYFDGARLQTRASAGGLVAIPEPRTDSLVLRGDRRDVLAAVKLAERIDASGDPVILIRQIQNADAHSLADVLTGIIRGKNP